MPDSISDIERCATLHQQSDHRRVAPLDRLVQWRRVSMVAFEVVAVGVLAGVKQQPNNLRMPVLRGQRECAVARFGVRGPEQTSGVIHETQSGSGGQINVSPAFRQSLGGVAHPEGKRGGEWSSPFPGASSFNGGAKIQ